MLDVQLCRFRRVMGSVVQVALCGMRVMGRQFMVSSFMMFCGFAMMPGRVVVVLGCLMMMFCRLFGHLSSSRIWWWAGGLYAAPGFVKNVSANCERSKTWL
jgi:hypothetical protein